MSQSRLLRLAIATCAVMVALPGAAQDAADTATTEMTHPIMQPDGDTLLSWADRFKHQPAANIDPLIRTRFGATAGTGTSFSLLPYFAYTPSTRNQSGCGDCWAWAGTAAVEMSAAFNLGVSGVQDCLSVQLLNSCDRSGAISGNACCGGTQDDVASWYQQERLSVPWANANAAFADGARSCPGSSPVACSHISTNPSYPIASISAATVPTIELTEPESTQNVMNVLAQNQAVVYSFYLPGKGWSSFFSFWDSQPESAIWDPDPYCGTVYNETSGSGGHSTLIVGYDTSNSDPDQHYWLVLNSWGTTAARPNGLYRVKMHMNYGCTMSYSGSSFYSRELETQNVQWNPASITGASYPGTVNNRDLFTITYSISSPTATTVLLGARMRPSGTSAWMISYPAGDAQAVLDAGSSSKSRSFVVGTANSPGSYDLMLTLWADVNQNGVIDSADGALSSVTYYGLTVQSPGPIVTSKAASGVGQTGATLTGTVNPNGSPTIGWFQWGTTTSYGNSTASQTLGSGTSGVALSMPISPLQCNTPYHFRAVGESAGGTFYGSDATFTSAACGGSLPNLAPYQPPGWSGPIVVSNVTGVTTDYEPLLPTDTLYVDWAAINNGALSVPTSPSCYFYLYLDGSLVGTWYASSSLDPKTYFPVSDYSLGSLSAGEHTLRLVCDATDVVAESNKADNEYTKTITVGSPAKFFPLAPCRILDTRVSSGPTGGAPLAASSRTVLAVAGACGVPTGATAIVANLTVVGATAEGDLQVTGGNIGSTVTSALSIPISRARANSSIIRLSADDDGTVAVRNTTSGTVHLILDVSGYFQ